ncbi:MAG: uroporphyrinogen decarboxylase family protein, partial [Halobacteria archaeon]|nr:uroporphyrinogen decarboxylase family protein [Halobacteria archaeon]
MNDLLVRAAHGEHTERPPVWLMRQAGRYIPEYREIRERHSFKQAIKNPDVAERISLLPWKKFEPDGVVMFSDILTLLEPLGFDYRIEDGVGPVIENPVESPDDALRDTDNPRETVEEELGYVGELLRRLNGSIGDEAAVIGFSGGPYTLASYVLDDCWGSEGRDAVRRFRARHPDAFEYLLDSFAELVSEYLLYQERNGADVVQLFDTWAGLLPPDDYEEFVLPLHRRVTSETEAPCIIFVRNPGGKLDTIAEPADVVSLDWTVDIAEARDS